jgi:glycosyltransferase involved in cell wall biosynthesis
MRILLLGDNPKNYWIGSSTLYIQQEYSNALGKKLPNAVDLFFPYKRRNIFHFLFGSIRITQKAHFREISCGIVPLLFHCLYNKYSIVHCIVIRNYMFWIVLLTKFLHLHSILTLHDTLFIIDPRKTLSNIARKLSLKLASAVLILSKTDEERIKSFIRDIQYYYIKHGITVVSEQRKIINTNKILFGGGLSSPNKGLNILEASIRKINSNVELIICGTNVTGIKHPAYYGEVNREEFNKLISNSRIVVISSEYESFSMIALESLSLGTPIILTESCGISSYLRNKIDCLKIPYGDVEALRNAIEILLIDDSLWSYLSENGRIAAQNFLWDNIVPCAIDIYKKVVI